MEGSGGGRGKGEGDGEVKLAKCCGVFFLFSLVLWLWFALYACVVERLRLGIFA